MDYNKQNNYYSKKSVWKWVLIYVVIGVVAYGLIYYFFFAKNGGYNYNNTQNNNYEQTTSVVKNDKDLISAIDNLDTTNINQLDSDLSQNEADARAF